MSTIALFTLAVFLSMMLKPVQEYFKEKTAGQRTERYAARADDGDVDLDVRLNSDRRRILG